VAAGQRLHVGDRRRGSAHRKAVEGSRNDRTLIVAPDQRAIAQDPLAKELCPTGPSTALGPPFRDDPAVAASDD
jgi:hypothetical protein